MPDAVRQTRCLRLASGWTSKLPKVSENDYSIIIGPSPDTFLAYLIPWQQVEYGRFHSWVAMESLSLTTWQRCASVAQCLNEPHCKRHWIDLGLKENPENWPIFSNKWRDNDHSFFRLRQLPGRKFRPPRRIIQNLNRPMVVSKQ